jgi:hypothetical protein
VPLENGEDPYARAGIARDVAKLWCIASFGESAPKLRWPRKMVEDYRKDTGKDLRKVATARTVAEASRTEWVLFSTSISANARRPRLQNSR